jgi:chromosome segregation ATPase
MKQLCTHITVLLVVISTMNQLTGQGSADDFKAVDLYETDAELLATETDLWLERMYAMQQAEGETVESMERELGQEEEETQRQKDSLEAELSATMMRQNELSDAMDEWNHSLRLLLNELDLVMVETDPDAGQQETTVRETRENIQALQEKIAELQTTISDTEVSFRILLETKDSLEGSIFDSRFKLSEI